MMSHLSWIRLKLVCSIGPQNKNDMEIKMRHILINPTNQLKFFVVAFALRMGKMMMMLIHEYSVQNIHIIGSCLADWNYYFHLMRVGQLIVRMMIRLKLMPVSERKYFGFYSLSFFVVVKLRFSNRLTNCSGSWLGWCSICGCDCCCICCNWVRSVHSDWWNDSLKYCFTWFFCFCMTWYRVGFSSTVRT